MCGYMNWNSTAEILNAYIEKQLHDAYHWPFLGVSMCSIYLSMFSKVNSFSFCSVNACKSF